MSSKLVGEIILGQFRVDSFLDAGGMGSVFRVWDQKRNVPLAMKILNAELSEDPIMFKRFQREARALKKLAHPNIVPFYGLYQTSDISFLLELLIDGPTLKDILKHRQGQPLSIQEVFSYLKVLCAALGYAHAKGVIHCDVKPANVMIDQGGNIYLTDFGIARHADSTSTSMSSAGTPAYMAPEQIKSQSVSPATDIYALGVLLFEMLTGQRPFRGDENNSNGQTAAERIRWEHINQEPPDPHSINPNLSRDLCNVILLALNKDSSQRFQSTSELFTSFSQAVGLDPDVTPDPIQVTQIGPSSIQHEIHSNPISKSNAWLAWLKANQNKVAISLGIIVILALLVKISSATNLANSTGSQNEQGMPNISSTEEPGIQQQTQQVKPTNTNLPAFVPIVSQQLPKPTLTKRPSPGKTPVKKVTNAYNASLYSPIPGCAPSHIHIGDLAMVTYGSGRNAIRSSPDTHPSDNKIGYAGPGELLNIIDGPICNYGWPMWKVHTSANVVGWTPETDGIEFWLEPIKQMGACKDALPSLIQKGDQAQVTLYPDVASRVRKDSNISSPKIGSMNPGTLMTILDGPECNNGLVWWKVQTKNGLVGWSAEGDNENYFLLPVPKPHDQ